MTWAPWNTEMQTKLEARFPADREAAAAARRSLDELAAEVDGKLLDDIKLLVSELVTNSVRHAGIANEDQIRLSIDISPQRVQVQVCDEGRGFVPRPVTRSVYTTGGWGLYFVGRLTDRWGVSSDGETCVWFEVDRTHHTAKRMWRTSPSRTA